MVDTEKLQKDEQIRRLNQFQIDLQEAISEIRKGYERLPSVEELAEYMTEDGKTKSWLEFLRLFNSIPRQRITKERIEKSPFKVCIRSVF